MINKLCFGGRLKSIPIFWAQTWCIRGRLVKRNTPGATKSLACFIPDPAYHCIMMDPRFKKDLFQVLGLLTHEMLHYDFELKHRGGAHNKRFNDRLKVLWRKVQRANEKRLWAWYVTKELSKIKNPAVKKIVSEKLKQLKFKI